MALLCHCHGVSDRTIAAAVDDGACSLDQVQEQCAAGTSCGGCLPAVDELVERLTARLSLVAGS